MRSLLIATCLANVLFAFGSLPWMPNPAAVHFGLDGTANRWEPPIVSAISMSIFAGMMAAVFIGVSVGVSMSANHMPQLMNLPNRDYWLNEENRPATIRRIRFPLEMIGIGTMFFILFLQWEIFQANQTIPPVLRDSSLYAVGILFAYILFEQVRLWRSFRLPKNNRHVP